MFSPKTAAETAAQISALQSQVAALEGECVQAVQAANFPKTNNTLANTSLTVNLEANSTYAFELYAPFTLAGVVSGFKFAFTTPASIAAIIWTPFTYTSLGAVLFGTVQTTAATLSDALATAANHTLQCRGTIINGANAGAFTLQWAQSTTDAGAATLLQGASLIARKI